MSSDNGAVLLEHRLTRDYIRNIITNLLRNRVPPPPTFAQICPQIVPRAESDLTRKNSSRSATDQPARTGYRFRYRSSCIKKKEGEKGSRTKRARTRQDTKRYSADTGGYKAPGDSQPPVQIGTKKEQTWSGEAWVWGKHSRHPSSPCLRPAANSLAISERLQSSLRRETALIVYCLTSERQILASVRRYSTPRHG